MLNDKEKLVSPITGGRMSLEWEWRDVEFRKENFHVMFPFYRCEDTGEQFTDTETDGVWYAQVHNMYCQKYGIPFTDEIVEVRERYGISSSKMSLILGFGANQWRRYEQEEIPSVSNGRMIRSIMNPLVFKDMLESSRHLLTEKEYSKISDKVECAISDAETLRIKQYETQRLFVSGRNIDNGFGQLSLERLKNVMLFVIGHVGEIFYTKMNKMLFYIDFVKYRETGSSLTGLSYRAIDYGPVPEKWEKVYSEFDEISHEPRVAGDFEGCVLDSTSKCDRGVFSEKELAVMQMVCERFKSCTAREMTRLSHEENAWKDCFEKHGIIPFEKAFQLKAL